MRPPWRHVGLVTGICLLVSGVAHGAAPAPGRGAGWAEYDAGDFVAALRLLRPMADAGDAQAQFGLGIAYDLGRGVAEDPVAACTWYRRAATGGQVAAMFNTALLYDNGRCGARRADLAAIWYSRAAAFGHARAQFDLAQLYESGDGVPRNAAMATAWYHEAAANGVTAAIARARAPSHQSSSGALLRVAPMDVGADFTTAALRPSMVLTWEAPEQPGPVRYFVEVMALDQGTPREVIARYVDVSATLVQLAPAANGYAWRVTTVGSAPAQYVTGPWQFFGAVEP